MTEHSRAVAAFGVPSRHEFPTDPLDAVAFDEVLEECEQHRILGFLGEAVRSAALPVTEDQRAAVEFKLQQWYAHGLRVEQLLLETLRVLASAQIPSRVLKGVALARTAYPRPELRVFGDVDLLVPSDSVGRAVGALTEALDARRAQPELRPGFDERFGKEVLLRRGETMELDLHRVFVEGAFGLTIDVDDLFAPPYRFPLAGYELEALPMPQRLLHAAYAAVLGDWPPRLVALRDVVQLVLRERPNLIDVLLMARAWRCEVVLAQAVTTAWSELAIVERPPIVEWAERYRPGRVDRLLLASHEGPARAFTRHLAALVVLPTLRDRGAYARAIAFPQRSYLEARSLQGTNHLKRAVGRLAQQLSSTPGSRSSA
jgi:Uncharacterised nucleotidyltransferase